MSVARHHAEWLSLVETSGPFLSMPVLTRVFPQGLDQRDPARASRLREAYEDWLERQGQAAVHHAWIRHVLTELLEYTPEFLVEGQAIPPGLEAVMANFGETLRPDYVLLGRRLQSGPLTPALSPAAGARESAVQRPDQAERADSTSAVDSPPSPPSEGGEGWGEVGAPRCPLPAPRPLLLIEHYPPGQDLEKPVAGKVWKASPGTRMMELLHASDVPLGLITNGEQWMLVYAPRGETTGFASWYADLWMQEPLTLRAFHSLLHLRRFLGVAEPETLAALYAESAKDQQEVTDQLGYQVRRAVEMLVQAFDRIDAESGRQLLAGVKEKDLYDGALTVMMRLVFLFSAEERGLLLLGDPLYDQHYAVSTLSELLRERADQHGEEVLERRHDAWSRLLATFRAVHGGVGHEAMRLPPYGGTLFDPDRYPFLEGRAGGGEQRAANGGEAGGWRYEVAKPLPINNRVVLHLLEALQVLRVKVPGGGNRAGSGQYEARRLSFRALDIEQIGHVYEGLLDHTAKRASEVILGLAGSRDAEPEIPLSKLEQLAGRALSASEPETAEPFLLAAERPGNVTPLPTGPAVKGYGPPEALVEFLQEQTGRSVKAIAKALTDQSRVDENRLLLACGQDRRLLDRVWRFAALLREDDFGQPVVIREGSVYVTRGSDRRSTGTHYTPRSLTEPIVQHTLEPLVYTGPAEGKPQAEWQLKSPRDLLALKVCDMTMGSGAFLVQTCRYLAERLVEAWEEAERNLRGPGGGGQGAGEANHDDSELSRIGGVATGDGPGGTVLSDHQVTPEGGTLRPDQPDALAPAPIPRTEAGMNGRQEAGGEVRETPPPASRPPLPSAQPLVVMPDGSLSVGSASEYLLPTDDAERLTLARRYVADRCLYGVDINPMAVEMAKLSLWLITLQRDRPFTFLDHALKCGDSLLGVSSVQQIENFSLRPGERQVTFATANLFRYVEEASAKRRALEDLPSNDHTQIEIKHRLHAEAEAATAKVKAVADCLIAFELRGLDGDAYEEQRAEEAEKGQLLMQRDADASLKSPISHFQSALATHACAQLRGRRPFHWPVEFPEVFAHGGFDAFVGNPPFMHGSRIAIHSGFEYTDYLRQAHPTAKGKVNLVVFFLLNAAKLRQRDGYLGLIVPDSTAEGADRAAGPQSLIDAGLTLYRVRSPIPWPGAASVIVAMIHFSGGRWNGARILNDAAVTLITSRFESDIDMGTPSQLAAMQSVGYVGVSPDSLGFLVEAEEAKDLLARQPDYAPVLKPYVSGIDLNRSPHLVPDRFIIDFTGLSMEEAARFEVLFLRLAEKVKAGCPWERWWQFNRPAAALYESAKNLTRLLVSARVTKHLAFQFAPVDWVYATKVVAIAKDSSEAMALFSSSIHVVWAETLGTSLGGTFNYQPTECIATFPCPSSLHNCGTSGIRYPDFRASIMVHRKEGLTDIYNRFHDRGEQSADIVRLRALHVEMDQTVALAYGWPILVNGQVVNPPLARRPSSPADSAARSSLPAPLDLGHGFHVTKQGERYTISEPARRIVLDRLLALNHQRYEEEVKAGLHEKKRGAKHRGKAATPAPEDPQAQLTLDIPATPERRDCRADEGKSASRESGSSAQEIDHRELLNRIFTCASRHEVIERGDLMREVARELGFRRLGSRVQEMIASGINSAIRRGLVGYDAQSIFPLARTHADLDLEALVAAVHATIKPGCVYTPEQAMTLAADYLGNKRMTDAFRELLQSALTAASRRGLITRRGDEVRKVT